MRGDDLLTPLYRSSSSLLSLLATCHSLVLLEGASVGVAVGYGEGLPVGAGVGEGVVGEGVGEPGVLVGLEVGLSVSGPQSSWIPIEVGGKVPPYEVGV